MTYDKQHVTHDMLKEIGVCITIRSCQEIQFLPCAEFSLNWPIQSASLDACQSCVCVFAITETPLPVGQQSSGQRTYC